MQIADLLGKNVLHQNKGLFFNGNQWGNMLFAIIMVKIPDP